MFKLNLGSLAFYIFAMVTAGMFIVELTNPNYSADSAIAQLVLALTGSVAIVPVHERIHAVTYKAIGAPKVRFIAEWRKGLILTIADRFVVNQREYLWLAIAPLLVISAALGGLYFLTPEYNLFIAGLLCFRTLSCVGDIAIVNFLWLRREMRSLVMMTTDCASVISTRNGQARLSAHRTHRQISDNRRRDHRHRRQPAVRNC